MREQLRYPYLRIILKPPGTHLHPPENCLKGYRDCSRNKKSPFISRNRRSWALFFLCLHHRSIWFCVDIKFSKFSRSEKRSEELLKGVWSLNIFWIEKRQSRTTKKKHTTFGKCSHFLSMDFITACSYNLSWTLVSVSSGSTFRFISPRNFKLGNSEVGWKWVSQFAFNNVVLNQWFRKNTNEMFKSTRQNYNLAKLEFMFLWIQKVENHCLPSNLDLEFHLYNTISLTQGDSEKVDAVS